MATAQYMANRSTYARPQGILFANNPGYLDNGVYVPEGDELNSRVTTSDNYFMILSDHNRKPIEIKNTRIEKRERMINGRMRSYHIADKMTISTSWELLPSRSYSANPKFKNVAVETITNAEVVKVNNIATKNVKFTTLGTTPTYAVGDIVTVSGIVPSGIVASPFNIENVRVDGVSENHFTVEFPAIVTGEYSSGGSATFNGSGSAISGITEYTVDGGAGGAELREWYNNHKGSFWVYLAYDQYTNFGTNNAAYAHLAQYNQIVEMFISDFSFTVEKRGGTNHDLWTVSISLEEA